LLGSRNFDFRCSNIVRVVNWDEDPVVVPVRWKLLVAEDVRELIPEPI
jgi:hypothetical protein